MASKIHQNWDFGYAIIPSGNLALNNLNLLVPKRHVTQVTLYVHMYFIVAVCTYIEMNDNNMIVGTYMDS
jgi:coproporphyrinogen III oxidase-like Fe-S oxidoreductase